MKLSEMIESVDRRTGLPALVCLNIRYISPAEVNCAEKGTLHYRMLQAVSV